MIFNNKSKAKISMLIRLAASAYLLYIVYTLVAAVIAGESPLSTPLTIIVVSAITILAVAVVVLTVVDWRRRAKEDVTGDETEEIKSENEKDALNPSDEEGQNEENTDSEEETK